jgi:hypothetical protein
MKMTSCGLLFFLALALAATAQTNSFPTSGNAGIGAGNSLNLANGLGHPSYVIGTWSDNNNSGIDFHAFGNSVDITALSIQPGTGYVGVGTTSPGSPLSVVGPNNPEQLQIQSTATGGHQWGIASWGTYTGFNSGGLGFGDFTAGLWRMYLDGAGNVGIGTTSPGATLDVNGNTQVDGTLLGSSGGAVNVGSNGIAFPNGGGTQTTAWTGVLCGGDYAEDMRTMGKEKYGPGDVLVLASNEGSDVQKSAEAYSTMVAGIYATKPGVVGRREAVAASSDNIPMAMVGAVPTKISTENGAIHRGDLLVTSSTAGYAMKGTDRSRMLGAVIGKAMGSLDSGTGVIEVLVTLQ